MLEKPHGSQNFQWIYLKHMNALWGGGMSHSMLIQLVQAGQNIAGGEVKTWGLVIRHWWTFKACCVGFLSWQFCEDEKSNRCL